MKVHEIMTAHARCVGPDNTLVEAAGLMRELDVGALPVCEDDRVTGLVTDRDLVLRGTADGRDPNTTQVREVMSPGVIHVQADQDVEEAARIMEDKQIQRLPVLNREQRLVGMLSLGDIATSSNPVFSGMALRDVSQPSNPSARQRRLTQQSQPVEMPEVPGARRGPGGGRSARGRRRATTTRRSAAAKQGSSRKRGTARTTRGGRSLKTVGQRRTSRGKKKSARGQTRRTTARARR